MEMSLDSHIRMLERFKQNTIKTLRMMYQESVMLDELLAVEQERFEVDLVRQEGILCKTNEKLKILYDKKAILCNQENAVETPVEPVCLADATSVPNEQKEAQKQR